MAGTIGLSLTQRLDKDTADPLNGGKLYFIQAGTTSTPQNAYQDSALTIPHPNPLTLDAGGNIPQLFFADGQIKIRLTNAAGINQLTADNIMVVGASSGGGGGGTVDLATILQTGDMKARYGTGDLTGFVRANGRTIGSVSSGASESASADAQALFEYLWSADPTLVVSTGRGVSANADWVLNKTIALPDWRGQAMAFLDDMGNSAAGVLTTAIFGTDPKVLGNKGGTEASMFPRTALPNVNMPLVGNAPGKTFLDTLPGSRPVLYPFLPANYTGGGPATFSVGGFDASELSVTLPAPTGNTRLNGNVTQTAMPANTPRRLATLYIKL